MPSKFYPDHPGELHPEAEALLSRLSAESGPPLSVQSPSEARQGFLPRAWAGEPRQDVAVRSALAGSVPLRIATPPGPGPHPVLVFFHGGGFVLGTLGEFEPLCTRLAACAGCIVVSVGYRLAPEAPFPAAVEDAWIALQWTASEAASFDGDPARLAVAGDSAGGNLAALVALRARDEGTPRVRHQVLICPWTDLSSGAEAAESFRHFGRGPWLSAESLAWYRAHYLAHADGRAASPLCAVHGAGLPPATILTAECDILADQGRAYADRLRTLGVPVTHASYAGMLHDFILFPAVFSAAERALDRIAQALKRAFAEP
ncbi:alpha/beta hydrolase [Geothrix sp. 21YS21S-4]|uniref:alpha/beta hydrolase n=1 Tax=Geothrix sp. 21YS21S-4 TaxID=3068889 RepID=UPI0027B92ACC|nr:alpha/beta hydrolase [Geothrix sp. 21YS21S-4]